MNNYATAQAHDLQGFSNAAAQWERDNSDNVKNDDVLVTVDFSNPWSD